MARHRKGHSKGRNRSKRPKGPAPNPLLEPGMTLSGPDLASSAQQLTDLETQPQINAYQRLIGELGAERGIQATGLQRLGKRTGRGVSTIYRNLAKSEADSVARQAALGNMLKGETQQAGQTSMDQMNQFQQAQGQQLQQGFALTGGATAPGQGPAQQQLAQMVAAQQARAVQNQAAAQNFATTQAGAYQGLAAGEAAATQHQGAEAKRDIARTIANRIAQSNLSAGQDIREARGKLSDTRALKGAAYTKNLLGQRENERNFMLGQAAIQQRADASALSSQTSLSNAALGASTSASNAALSAATSTANTHYSQRQQNKRNRRSNRSGGGAAAKDLTSAHSFVNAGVWGKGSGAAGRAYRALIQNGYKPTVASQATGHHRGRRRPKQRKFGGF